MLSKILQALAVGALLILGYNYFFGNTAEKAQAQGVAKEVKEGVVALKDFIVAQKDKADLATLRLNADKAGDLIKQIGHSAAELDSKTKAKLDELDTRRAQLEQSIGNIDKTARDAQQKKQAAEAQLTKLVNDIDALTKDMDKK